MKEIRYGKCFSLLGKILKMNAAESFKTAGFYQSAQPAIQII
jgi:hypothetical protein